MQTVSCFLYLKRQFGDPIVCWCGRFFACGIFCRCAAHVHVGDEALVGQFQELTAEDMLETAVGLTLYPHNKAASALCLALNNTAVAVCLLRGINTYLVPGTRYIFTRKRGMVALWGTTAAIGLSSSYFVSTFSRVNIMLK